MARQQELGSRATERSQYVLRPNLRNESSIGLADRERRIGKRASQRRLSSSDVGTIDGTSDTGDGSTTDSEWLIVDLDE